MCIKLQLQRFQDAHKEHLVCRFANAIYKLKKSPRSRFRRSPYRLNIYVKSSSQGIFILVVYAEDLIIKRSEASTIREIKSQSCSYFDTINVSLLNFCLGVEFVHSYIQSGVHFFFQGKYPSTNPQSLSLLEDGTSMLLMESVQGRLKLHPTTTTTRYRCSKVFIY